MTADKEAILIKHICSRMGVEENYVRNSLLDNGVAACSLIAMDEYAASLIKERDDLKEKYENLVKANSFKGQLNSEYYEKLTALQSSNEAKEKECADLKEVFGTTLKVLRTMMDVAKLEHGVKKADELLKMYEL